MLSLCLLFLKYAESTNMHSSISENSIVTSQITARQAKHRDVAVTHLIESESDGRDTNSAVIALLLGLSVTALLIAIVGYRMKSIRNRIARRGAYDAEYLIDGMYM